MFDKTREYSTENPVASIYLDYGADEEKCSREVQLSERGMSFKSHWKFDLGTELAISLAYRDGASRLHRFCLEGTVVGFEPVSEGCNCVTLLFVDLPDEFRPAIRLISNWLETAPTIAGA